MTESKVKILLEWIIHYFVTKIYGKRVGVLLLLTALSLVCCRSMAFTTGFFKVTEPVSEKECDLNINLKYLNFLSGETLIVGCSQWQALAEMIKSGDEDVLKAWNKLVREARGNLLKGGYQHRSGSLAMSIGGKLQRLSLVYRLTGNKALGKYLRNMVLYAAKQDEKFWVYAKIRPYKSGSPLGSLESATLTQGVALALSWNSDLFSAEEKREIEKSLKEKGYLPGIRYISRGKPRHNWFAVISSSTYITAQYFHDDKNIALASDIIEKYLGLLEEDGSYGEPLGYFFYPMRYLQLACAAMPEHELKKLMNETSLGKSLDWILYYYYFNRNAAGKPLSHIVVFGDGEFRQYFPSIVYFLSCALNKGTGIWLMNQLRGFPAKDGVSLLIMKMKYHGKEPERESPEQAGLPLVKTFDNGLMEIRSSWNVNSTTLALKSGGATRCSFSHDRPNRNAIVLSAFGEYLLVTPNRACYRSPTRYNWDLRTSSYSTVTIDGKNQYTPCIYTWKNFPVDLTAIPKGKPVAKIEIAKSGKYLDVLQSDAAEAWPTKPLNAKRTVVYVKPSGYFLILDKYACKEQHQFHIAYYGNNVDGKARLNQMKQKNKFLFSRPQAELLVQIFPSLKSEYSLGKGIMHHKLSYTPGKGEGKMGSSLKIAGMTKGKSKSVVFCTVLFPRKVNSQRDFIAETVYDGNKLCVKVKLTGQKVEQFKINNIPAWDSIEFQSSDHKEIITPDSK